MLKIEFIGKVVSVNYIGGTVTVAQCNSAGVSNKNSDQYEIDFYVENESMQNNEIEKALSAETIKLTCKIVPNDQSLLRMVKWSKFNKKKEEKRQANKVIPSDRYVKITDLSGWF